MRASKTLAAASGIGLALAASPARGHAPDSFGVSARDSALSGAVVADSQDFTAVYYNPAGLASAEGVGLSIGYAASKLALRLDGADTNARPVRGLTMGLLAPGKLGRVPFGIGLIAYLPDDALTQNRSLPEQAPRWEIYGERQQIFYFAAGVALQPLPWLEIGAGLGFVASTEGRLEISGVADAIEPYKSKLRHEVDAGLQVQEFPQAGVRVKVPRVANFGLAYRGKSQLDLGLRGALTGEVDYTGVRAKFLYELETATISAYLPQQAVLGGSLTAVPNLRVNVDVTWLDWSAYESPVARTTAVLEADVPEGLDIALPPPPKKQVITPPAFEDRFVPRVGVEYVLGFGKAPPREKHPKVKAAPGDDKRPFVTVPLRAGYRFERSPVPDQTGNTNYVDTDRHTISAGFGVGFLRLTDALPGRLHLDVNAAYSVLPERRITKASAADFVGDYSASGSMIGGGAVLGLDFE